MGVGGIGRRWNILESSEKLKIHTHTHRLLLFVEHRSIFLCDCFRSKISSSLWAQYAGIISESERTIVFDLRDRHGIESQTAESFLSAHQQSWKRFSQSVSGPLFGALYHSGFSQCVFKLWVTPGSLPDWHNPPRRSDRSSASEEEWNSGRVRVTHHREANTGCEGAMHSQGKHLTRVLPYSQRRKPEEVGWRHWKALELQGQPWVQTPPPSTIY